MDVMIEISEEDLKLLNDGKSITIDNRQHGKLSIRVI